MGKFSYKYKINIYYRKKNYQSIKSIANKYKTQKLNVVYIVKLIDKHRFDILRTSDNKYYH